MKKLFFALACISLMSFSGEKDKYPVLKIGDQAPMIDYKMRDVSGVAPSLSEIKDANGLCVIFSCNTCPFVVGRGEENEGWEGRYNDVANWCSDNKIGVVFVNSNEAKREGVDSMEEMQKHAKENNYNFKYVEDKNSQLANAFGAKTTPHVFLFDKNMALAYEGAIDDNNASAEKVKQHYLKDALVKLAKGEKIDPNNTNALGCSIKRL